MREAMKELSEREAGNRELEKQFEGIEEIETGPVIRESFLSRKIEERKPEKVAGVDGGILRKRYSSSDLVAVRAVAAVFSFGEQGVTAEYIPGKNADPEFHVLEPGDQESFEAEAEKKRLGEEVQKAVKALEKADKVLMDGSIVPSYSGEEEILEKYEDLYDRAGKGQLAGVVEDSYGLKLGKMISEKLGIDTAEIRDTLVMDAVLEQGERSFVRRYSRGVTEHPALKNIREKFANKIHTFYVKPSSKDLPLRVDYFGEVEDADRIAAKLLFMKSSDTYTVPSPILEADKRAKIPEKYIQRIEKRFSPALKRRERRSF